MDAVEPRQHTAVSATSSTLWSTVKGALVGPFEGAGLGAIVGAVAVGGLAAAIAARRNVPKSIAARGRARII